MRKLYYLIFLLLSCFNGSLYSRTGTGIKENIDWEKFMERQDMTWDVLPKYWYEAPFMGNGKLGLQIYKQPGENYIRLETGNTDVHDHRGKGLYGNPRLLTGHFAIYPKGEIQSGSMRADLWNAETNAVVRTTQGEIAITAMVHSDDMVICVKCKTTGNESYDIKWIPANADSPRYIYGNTPAGAWMKRIDYKSNPVPETQEHGQGGCSVQKLLHGGETAVCWETENTNDGDMLWANVTHTYPGSGAKEISISEIKKAKSKGYNKLRETHREWWHDYYKKSFLSLDDAQKENFYWIQLYKYACATRPDRGLIDNTGPWLTITPWPNAWWNLNVQLTYWALNTSNHTDLAQSLENAIYNNVENLRNNIPEEYRHNSLGIGRTSDLVCDSEIVGIPGKSKTPEIGLLTWTCHNLWLIYRHRMDDETLRDKLFPVLKGAINYYLHFLYEDPDGTLHLPATYSPEYGSAEDCNFDLALLNWGCKTLIETNNKFGLNDPLADKWRNVVKNITPYPQDENGLMIGKDTPYAFSHRHYSHLLAIYPLYLITPENEDDKRLIEKSLEYWFSKPKALRGYSYTGAASISALLGKGDDALGYLDQLFSDYLGVNTLYRESGPVIETPLSAAQSMHDMLLQSWENKIRLFPAVPAKWKDITFHNWLTEGAFLVSAKRENGKTTLVRIKSLKGEPCTITTDMENPVTEKKNIIKKTGANTYSVSIKKGEEVLIYANGEKGSQVIAPVRLAETNVFGKKH